MLQIRKIFTGTILTLLLLTATCIPKNSAIASDYQCQDVHIIFARGSGEQLQDVSETAWRENLSQNLQETELSYTFYELGSEAHNEHQYPAVAVGGSVGGMINLAGAYISAGSSFDFGHSVYEGQQELLSYIQEVSSKCPKTKFVMGGYSQGAMLISGILDKINADRVIYAATFGDPKLYLPEGKGIFPDACFGKNLSNYRVNVMDCRAYQGILGSYQPYQPKSYQDKLGTWCNNEDIMCSSRHSLKDHTSYVASNLYGQATHVIMQKLQATYPAKVPEEVTNKPFSTHDLAILIDSTGSMSSTINSYKSEAKRLAQKIIKEGGRVALFEYRDLKDGFETTLLSNLSNDYENFVSKIDQITVDGGGDYKESALSGALHVMNTLKWQSGATKSVILLTDAGYHSPDVDGTTVEQVVKRSLEIDPVNIYVLTDSTTAHYYQELVTATHGRVFNIEEEITLSTDTILNRPKINFPLAEYYGTIGQTFTFSLQHETANDDTKYLYEWDLDNDNIFEYRSTKSTIDWKFDQSIEGYIQARVTTPDGISSTASAKLKVVHPDEITIATIDSIFSKSLSTNSAEVNFSSQNTNTILLILNDNLIGQIPTDQNSITITDLTSPITLTLVPYNPDGIRGISKSITISPRIPQAPRTGDLRQTSY